MWGKYDHVLHKQKNSFSILFMLTSMLNRKIKLNKRKKLNPMQFTLTYPIYASLNILYRAYICGGGWVAKSCLTLCDPMDCNAPGASVHGIFQARILEWVAIPSSRGRSWSRNQICVSCIEGGLLHHKHFLYCWVTREDPHSTYIHFYIV